MTHYSHTKLLALLQAFEVLVVCITQGKKHRHEFPPELTFMANLQKPTRSKKRMHEMLSSGELNPGLPRVVCEDDKRKY